jgi:nucleoside-diphosphate-sugar epimerase
MGIPFKMKKIPTQIALTIAWFSEKTKGKGATTREHIRILSSDRIFDCAKAKRELGFAPRPLEQGIKEMVQELKQRAVTIKNTNH